MDTKTLIGRMAAPALFAVSLTLVGCEESADDTGMENAAEQVEETTEDAADTVQDAAEDAAEATEDAVEDAADAVDDATGDDPTGGG
ncbi:MAG: hypothetical protein ACF8Q5_05415 [Phycisphaerales bacterium JB040]